eukprot:TRINITY_DN63202_c0_g1_i1.p1 TRINITY_DN63202_c0_g1~~TRINITY_DN63202_c0_g1_i1.p1  ORF type:complete len:693 (-),score=87.69 TRINITY_DN63202_c0_g1_i1:454-2532(-)
MHQASTNDQGNSPVVAAWDPVEKMDSPRGDQKSPQNRRGDRSRPCGSPKGVGGRVTGGPAYSASPSSRGNQGSWELGELIEQRVGDELAAIQMAVTAHSRQILLHVANLVRALPDPHLRVSPEYSARRPLQMAAIGNGSYDQMTLPSVPQSYPESWSGDERGMTAMWQPLHHESYSGQHQRRLPRNGSARRQRGGPAPTQRAQAASELDIPTKPSMPKAQPPQDDSRHGAEQAMMSVVEKKARISAASSSDNEHVAAPKKRTTIKKRFSAFNQKQRTGIFVDKASHQADKIISQLTHAYDVRDMYKDTGIFQKIARSSIFENLTLVLVTVNAFWMWVDADLNGTEILVDAPVTFIIAENFFCFYFFLEWTCRALSFRRFCDGFRDTWFVFDGMLAALMVFETWIITIIVVAMGSTSGGGINTSSLRVLRLLRLSKLARMARLVRFIPELLIMIKGLAAGFRSVMTTLMLLMVTVYVFALGFRSLTAGSLVGDEYFPTVYDSILNLLVRGILPDHEDFVYALRDEHWGLGYAGLVFVFIATLTILNLLVGVLCEAVSVVATVEKEQLAAELVKSSLSHILADVDQSGMDDADKQISVSEFEMLVQRKDFASAVTTVGVDIHALCGLSDEVFSDGKTLSFEDFYKLLLQMRGSNYATVKHVIDIRLDMQDIKKSIMAKVEEERVTMMRAIESSK